MRGENDEERRRTSCGSEKEREKSRLCRQTVIVVLTVILIVSFPEFRNLSSFSLAVLKLPFLCTNKDSYKKYERNLRTLHEKKGQY